MGTKVKREVVIRYIKQVNETINSLNNNIELVYVDKSVDLRVDGITIDCIGYGSYKCIECHVEGFLKGFLNGLRNNSSVNNNIHNVVEKSTSLIQGR